MVRHYHALKLVLIWHQHQPPYRDPLTGDHIMPWVRMHALKDYVDMVQTILAAPDRVRCTINLTPTLLNQLLELQARPERERMRRLSGTPPGQLSAEERKDLITESFSVHHETMLKPYGRYLALLRQFQDGPPFSDQDVIDASVWFHLAWCGVSLRQEPDVAALFKKGADFTLEERDTLLRRLDAFVAEVIPIHKRAVAAGRIEVSTSPYHHPILPLLCASEAATEADPGCPLPSVRFHYPQDARQHLARAVALHTELFGSAPQGMWPSEGAVSDAAVGLIREHDLRWIATDEAILSRALGRTGQHHQVWSWRDVAIFFRDHELSDRIGFVYSRWEPARAAADFVEQLRRRAASPDATITVALDGENAWEHFPGGGYDFLSALYAELARAPDIEMLTPSEWLQHHRPKPLERFTAGTWIDGSFRTWIGDPIKNRAWELVANARIELLREPPGPTYERALESMLAAEASDWFWWFGEGHSSTHDLTFDRLFRRHLMGVYEALNRPIPGALLTPLAQPERDPTRLEPARLGRPRVDGERTPFHNWSGAGRVTRQQGSIHQTEPLMQSCWALYDAERLTLRLDTRDPVSEHLAAGLTIELFVLEPHPAHIRFDATGVSGNAIEAAAGNVIELSLPAATLGKRRMFWRALRAGEELERFPRSGELVVDVRGAALDLENWVV